MSNLSILEQLIIKYPGKSWNDLSLIQNSNISLEFITNHFDKWWRWEYLSIHPIITLKFITNNINALLKLKCII